MDSQEIARTFDEFAICLKPLEDLSASGRMTPFAANSSHWASPLPTTVGEAFDRIYAAVNQCKPDEENWDLSYYPGRPLDWLKPYPTTLGEAWTSVCARLARIGICSHLEP